MGLITDIVDYFRQNPQISDIKDGVIGDFVYYIAVILNDMGYKCEKKRCKSKSMDIAIRNFQHDIGVKETGNINKNSKEFKELRNYVLNQLYLKQ